MHGLGTERGTGCRETLEFDEEGHCEGLLVKNMSGDDVTSGIKAAGVKPGEATSLGRDRVLSVLNPSMVATDRDQEQNLEGAARGVGAGRATAR